MFSLGINVITARLSGCLGHLLGTSPDSSTAGLGYLPVRPGAFTRAAILPFVMFQHFRDSIPRHLEGGY